MQQTRQSFKLFLLIISNDVIKRCHLNASKCILTWIMPGNPTSTYKYILNSFVYKCFLSVWCRPTFRIARQFRLTDYLSVLDSIWHFYVYLEFLWLGPTFTHAWVFTSIGGHRWLHKLLATAICFRHWERLRKRKRGGDLEKYCYRHGNEIQIWL